jgi:hypothetical protein
MDSCFRRNDKEKREKAKVKKQGITVKTIRLLVLAACGLIAGCSVVDFLTPEGPPANGQIYATYRQIALKTSNSAEVLTAFDNPEYALISQSKSIIALVGQKKKGYKTWFDMVTFDESGLTAKRKYVYIADERPKQLFVEPWEGVYFDCKMVLPQKVLDEPYANENARREAILKQVGSDIRKDTSEVGADNEVLGVGGMVVGQAIDAVTMKLDSSPALARRLTDPNGLEFVASGFDKGLLRMVVDDDVVTVRLRLGSFAKELKVDFDRPVKAD